MQHDRILILDFGAQYTQLIARRVRESGVYCEIHPFNKPLETIRAFGAKGIILSGGPASVKAENAPKIGKEIFELGVPVLGICYGEQLMCSVLGGSVEVSDHREFGRATITIHSACGLFDGLWQPGNTPEVWMSHGDRVTALPEGFTTVATTPSSPFAAIANEAKQFYGVQFHPEVAHTPDGAKLLANFCLNIAKCAPTWSMASFREAAIRQIREQVGSQRVICGVSGGVDSTVVAKLIHEAIGEQLTCIFVDTGLLRADEAQQVVTMFREEFNIPLVHRDASKEFLGKLHGIEDPERKRKLIGVTFIEVFEEEAAKIGGAAFLAQGTLYPDVIESVSFVGGPSATIKSHHNVGGLPERMNMQLVEPVRSLFKDEVRSLGRELGISEQMIRRHPFPGPGLAIRIPGEITPEKVAILQKADRIYIEEIRKAGLYDVIWQAFAVLLPVRSVGVMGDDRTYDFTLSLRAVTSTDGMTADFYHFDLGLLGRISNRIVNEVRGVNRVLYDVTSKPPATIEWE